MTFKVFRIYKYFSRQTRFPPIIYQNVKMTIRSIENRSFPIKIRTEPNTRISRLITKSIYHTKTIYADKK